MVHYAGENWIAYAQIVKQNNVVQDDRVALLQQTSSVVLGGHECNQNIYSLVAPTTIGFASLPGMTLIHIASSFGLLSVVSCILERDTRNTEIDARDDEGQTPLHYAAGAGHEAIVRQFLKNKAEKNAKNMHDPHPYMRALTGCLDDIPVFFVPVYSSTIHCTYGDRFRRRCGVWR